MKWNKNLIKGSIILLVSFGIFNFLNFVFQFSMARLLTIKEFGVLSTLFTIIYILGGFSESIQTIMTKYSSTEKNKGKVKNVLKRALKKSFIISSLFFFVYLVFSIVISLLTKINYFLVSLTGLVIFIAFLSPISRGMLQGRKKFKELGINMVLESSIKLILAVFLVIVGFKVYGAVIGAIFGGLIAFAFSFIGLKDILKSKNVNASVKEIYNYTTPSFFIVLTILIFYSLDIFIARIVFSPEVSGIYSIASILSKIIFFGTQPISRAMFPLSSESNSIKKNTKEVFVNSFSILLLGIIPVLGAFYFFSNQIVSIFSGRDILGASSILFYLGISTSITSLTNLILLYKLSIEKIKGYLILPIFILSEILLLVYFSHNLIEFSIAFIVASAAFLWGAIVLIKN